MGGPAGASAVGVTTLAGWFATRLARLIRLATGILGVTFVRAAKVAAGMATMGAGAAALTYVFLMMVMFVMLMTVAGGAAALQIPAGHGE